MALASSTFAVQASRSQDADVRRERLLHRHRAAVDKVVADARTFSEDLERTLSEITDEDLRQAASR